MKRLLFVVALTLASGAAGAQQTTERYIPIGESPALSGRMSAIGTIAQIDSDGGAMVYETNGATRRCTFTRDTTIYVDRSKAEKENLIGSVADLKPGRRVEVSYYHPETPPGETPEELAHWIKVEAAD